MFVVFGPYLITTSMEMSNLHRRSRQICHRSKTPSNNRASILDIPDWGTRRIHERTEGLTETFHSRGEAELRLD
jgi:hypothetical protein